jgi:hypothetical protein
MEIDKIGTKRDFPQINTGEEYHDELPHMHVDHITFEDLIEFQKIKCQVIRGYY